ncbi:MAG: hypothetical protein KGQ67_16850, partial [Betaproteobacteria bacterium]|nr:hypothetical protein [Betaproteobacteria bacterium]
MTRHPALAVACLLCLAGPLLVVDAALAQTAAPPAAPGGAAPNRESLSVDQMLEQLAPTGRTRGMRNLVPVQVQPPPAAPAAGGAAAATAPLAAPAAAAP